MVKDLFSLPVFPPHFDPLNVLWNQQNSASRSELAKIVIYLKKKENKYKSSQQRHLQTLQITLAPWQVVATWDKGPTCFSLQGLEVVFQVAMTSIRHLRLLEDGLVSNEDNSKDAAPTPQVYVQI